LSSGGANDFAGIDGTVFFFGKNSILTGAFFPIVFVFFTYSAGLSLRT